MNTICLSSIHRQTGLRDQDIKKQIYDEALGAYGYTRHQPPDASQKIKYLLEITGDKGTYTIEALGENSLRCILDYFDNIEDRIAAGHDAQIDQRLRDIDNQRQAIGYRGQQANRAQDALSLAEQTVMDKVGYPPRPYSAGEALASMRPRELKACPMCSTWFVGYKTAKCCSSTCRSRKARQNSD